MVQRLAVIAIAGASVGLFLTALAWAVFHPAHPVAPSMAGKSAPAVAIRTVEGTEYDVGKLRGMPVVLNFWASWCVPCRQEAPVLGAAARRWQGQVQFLGADIQDSESAARAYEAEIKDPYPTGPIVRGSYLEYGVTAPPETVFIDRHGIVFWKFTGPLSDKLISIYITELLGQ